MSDQDSVDDALERLEWAERDQEETPHSKWRAFSRRTALTGAGAAAAAMAIDACGGGSSTTASADASKIFGSQPAYKFTLVNHVTTNPFFIPTKYGAADACNLLGCSYQWTGSQSSNVNEMVNAMNSAIAAGVDGIGVALVDLTRVQHADQKCARQGHPRRRLQRRRRGQRAPRVHRPGPVTVRPGDGQADRRAGAVRRRRAVHRDARLGSTSSPGSTAPKESISKSGKSITVAHGRHRRGPSRRSCRRSSRMPRRTPPPSRACSRSTPEAPKAWPK